MRVQIPIHVLHLHIEMYVIVNVISRERERERGDLLELLEMESVFWALDIGTLDSLWDWAVREREREFFYSEYFKFLKNGGFFFGVCKVNIDFTAYLTDTCRLPVVVNASQHSDDSLRSIELRIIRAHLTSVSLSFTSTHN